LAVPDAPPVLLVRTNALGDVILATSAVARFRRHRPDTPLLFLTRAEWAPVLYGHPDIARVLVLAAGPGGLEGAPSLARRLRGEGISGVIDLQGNLRSRLATLLLRPPRAVRWRSRAMERRLAVRLPWLRRRSAGTGEPPRVIDAYAEAVDRFANVADGGAAPAPRVYLGEAELAWAGREMERFRIPAGAVGLCPGARRATKRWPVEYYAEVIDRLAARGQAVVPVFLSSSTADLETEAHLRRAVRRPEAMRLVRQPLRRAAALMARCRTVVTNDSGMMHLAAAVGTPVVALFGPTVASFGFFPAGPGHRVLERELPCRPCSVHGGARCPRGHFRCMKEIAPEDVLSAVERSAGNPGAEERRR